MRARDEIMALLAAGETNEHFVVEGRQAVAAALDSDFVLEAVFSAGLPSNSVTEPISRKGVPVFEISKREASALRGYPFHRGLLAVARKPERSLADWAEGREQARVVILESLADPGNIGTVIRNAAAFGLDAVVCTKSGASPYNAKAVRASATTLFLAMPVFVLGADWLERVREVLPGLVVVGTVGNRQTGATIDDSTRLPRPDFLAVVFGGEAEGLGEETRKFCDHLVTVPISGRVESLNVASASAIVLHALG